MSGFDMAAYLKRLGLGAAPAPDAAGLMALQQAQRRAIAFENLDVFLGRPISLDPDALLAKLVHGGRGGFCFEQNGLFLAALRALGFAARPLMARVWWHGPEAVPPRSHCLVLVDLDDEPWIADAGFGGGYTPPMRLEDGEVARSPDGAVHRLTRDPDHGWMLSSRPAPPSTVERADVGLAADDPVPQPWPAAEPWRAAYSFTLDPVHPADLALGCHWAATAPDSRFTRERIASIVLPRGLASLTDRSYVRTLAGDRTATTIDDPRAYRLRLAMMFGITLDEREVAALGLFDG